MATYKEQISKAAAQQTSPPIQRLCADFDAQIGQWTPGNIEPPPERPTWRSAASSEPSWRTTSRHHHQRNPDPHPGGPPDPFSDHSLGTPRVVPDHGKTTVPPAPATQLAPLERSHPAFSFPDIRAAIAQTSSAGPHDNEVLRVRCRRHRVPFLALQTPRSPTHVFQCWRFPRLIASGFDELVSKADWIGKDRLVASRHLDQAELSEPA